MKKSVPTPLYNTISEVGARLLIILGSGKSTMSLERLQMYDHIILHLGDIQGNLPSIHPANPSHSSEIVAKRQLIRSAITSMALKGLVTVKYTNSGFLYASNKMTESFLNILTSNYSKKVRANSVIVCKLFSDYSDSRLRKLADNGLQNWAGEIEKIYSSRGNRCE